MHSAQDSYGLGAGKTGEIDKAKDLQKITFCVAYLITFKELHCKILLIQYF